MDKSEKKEKWKAFKKNFIMTFLVIAAAFFIRFYVVCTIQVKGSSMNPLFHHKDIVVVDQISYSFSDPQQKEIIICSYQQGVKEKYLIKRVIGVPGDEIDLKKVGDGEELEYAVLVNGQLLQEPYLLEKMKQKGDITYPFQVSENCYFVMGDNRNASSDSRFQEIGQIPKSQISGKVIFRLFPWNQPHFVQ